MTAINEQWQQIALEIGEGVYRTVNTPSTIGGDDETGYILMFFNAKHHDGQSTLVSSNVDRKQLKKLLKHALGSLDGPKTRIIEPQKAN